MGLLLRLVILWLALPGRLPAQVGPPPVIVSLALQNGFCVLAFAAATGQVYTVQATADLASPVWTNPVGSVVGVGSVMEFVDAGVTAPSRFYRVAVGAGGPAPVYSLNVVGYVNRLMQTGTNLVANPLDAWDNTITNVLWNCPDGTVIYDSFGGSSECYGGVWAPASLSLNPGDGVILVNPSGPFLVTFAGEVMQGALTNPLPAQPMLKSSMAPVAGLWEFPAQEGDQIQTWDVTNQTFVMHTFSDGAWTNTPPTVQPGEAFWVNVSAATNWVQNFTVFGGGPPIFSAPQLSGGKSNITFQLSGPAGSDYVLQVSTNLLNWSPVNTSTIPVSGSINLTNPITGTSRRFYRVYLQ